MSQEQCIDGSRMIVQWVKDMAGRRGITLDEAHWLPDPAQEAPDESSERYTLVVVAAKTWRGRASRERTLKVHIAVKPRGRG